MFASTRSLAGSTPHPARSSHRGMAADGDTTVSASSTDFLSIQSSSRSATWSSGCPLPSRFAHSVGLRRGMGREEEMEETEVCREAEAGRGNCQTLRGAQAECVGSRDDGVRPQRAQLATRSRHDCCG